MNRLRERIASLSSERSAVFQALLEASRGGARIVPTRFRTSSVPMSFAQRRLWFLDQLDPGNPAYTCPIPIRLRGPLDVAALASGLRTIVRRHEVLRTTYTMDGGEPVQFVHQDMDVPLPITDLAGRPEQESAIQRLILEDSNRPFDLAAGPVIRTELIRVDDEDHVLLFDIHHIANDAWSVGIFLRELSALYDAAVGGGAIALAELPVQYADYSLWQREQVQTPATQNLLSFWKERLSGLVPVDMPTDHLRPPVLSHRGGLARLSLPISLIRKLQEIAKVERATLYMTLLAGFKVLLARYTGSTDIAVGTSATGRDRPEVEGVIGFFVNTVVIRTDLSSDPTFRELLRRVRSEALAAYSHSELPFDVLVQELNPPRDASRTPLVPVMFILDETPDAVPPLHGLSATLLEPDFTTAKFDLLINARLNPGGVYAHVQYSADLFDPDSIERLVAHYRTILESAADNPDGRMSEMTMLTEPERHRLLQEVNNTDVSFPRDSCLHELFEENVASDPDATGIVFHGRRVSYRELDERSSHLARRLRERGVGPDVRVALCLDRSPELVIGILAVLKAGGAYVPLDPSYPRERLSFMLEDARAHVLLTRKTLEPTLQGFGAAILCLDAEADLRADVSEGAGLRPTPENLAYVIYTSGSTGHPKGISLRHRGVVNNLVDMNRRYCVGPGDRVLFLSSPSFDMSVYETLGMLVSGASTVIPDPADASDPACWIELMTAHGVTIWNSAPALLELLVEEMERRGGPMLPGLKVALLGGDWIPVSLPDRLRAFAPAVQFISLGGATEASIHSIVYPVGRVDPAWKTIPYGLPMANQRAYILDRWGQPVPTGVSGELHLAGEGLARGYLEQPELTGERFIEHTFVGGRVERLYRTGDLARWRKDENIELLGRMDYQVKIHGLRTELGEIESVLRRHELVEDAVVVQRHDQGMGKYLAAYFVLRPGCEISENELRRHLVQSLPVYMVPAAFVRLAQLPTNPNGKIDRRGLPAPERRSPRADDVAPRNETEERIASVWCSILQVERIGIDNNFFELGGDSFKAIRAVRAIGENVRVIELFRHPTVRLLAAHLHGRGRTEHMLHRLGSRRPARLSLVCIPYGGGNATAYQPLAEQLPPALGLWSVSLPGHDPGERNEPLVGAEAAARRCASEVLERISGPLAVYGHCAGVAVAVELARELEQRGADLRAVYLGAALPDPNPAASLEREHTSSDGEMFSFISSLGGFDGPLASDDATRILQVLRHDLVEASRFFARGYESPGRRLRAPVRCLLGAEDPATATSEDQYREWGMFATSIELTVIPGAGHYFMKHQAAEVADIIARYHPDGDERAVPAHEKQVSP